MSTVNAQNSVLTYMPPPRARLSTVQHESSSAPTDAATLSGASAAEESPVDSPGVSLTTQVAAGLGLALALTGAVAGCTGSVPVIPAPAAVAVIGQTQPGMTAIGSEAQQLMKDIASPSITDNLTANQVRNRYGAEVDDVLARARTFEELSQHLTQVGEKLTAYSEQYPDGGSFADNGELIGVERSHGKVTVTRQSPDSAVTEAVISRHSTTVKERDALGNTSTLESTARYVRVSEGGVTMTVHRQSGKFEMVSQEGPRTQVKVTVDGASIKEERRESISGFAGMIEVSTTTHYDVPETSMMVYPRVVVTESKTTTTDDGYGGRSTTGTRTEVYDNGATKKFEKGPDGKELLLESDGPAILIARR